MTRHRFTIKELEETSNKGLILKLIAERQTSCTNPYSPLARHLERLYDWVKENVKGGTK